MAGLLAVSFLLTQNHCRALTGYCAGGTGLLIPSHFLRCDGVPVQSAEIDHLVVGPTGVFVLETKCWSAKFVANGEYFSPFAQVKRAGLLCHVLLKDAGLPARVRQLIVPFAEIPDPPRDRWTSIVRPGKLAGRISHSAQEIDPQLASRIAMFLWTQFGGRAVVG